jgi:HNH endonuclease
MRYWIGLTDYDWFRSCASLPEMDEVNFWQPSAHRMPVRLSAGDLFLFKLHADHGGWIVGGGNFATYSPLPIEIAWATFGVENGAANLEEMTVRIGRYRRKSAEIHADQVGCLVIVQPLFLKREDWISPPSDWAPNIVQGKTYESESGEGARIWLRVQAARAAVASATHAIAEDRYGPPTLVAPRLGQGAFRLMVTDAYQRRCAVSGERTLPVLDAAHIKPYASSGPHRIDNGLLLRKDLHALFDAGYVTVTPALQVRVSRRIREEFLNGRDYYALDGRDIRLPTAPNPPPNREFLEWHGDSVFRS